MTWWGWGLVVVWGPGTILALIMGVLLSTSVLRETVRERRHPQLPEVAAANRSGVPAARNCASRLRTHGVV